MKGELSHGLPELATSHNRIVRADTGGAVLLRGVNRSGLEYTEPNAAGFLAAAQITQDEIREIADNWKANIIRLPFNQDWCLRGRAGHSAEEYLTSLDQVISWAASFGSYTILDLQWLDADTVYGHTKGDNGAKQSNRVPPTPNRDSIVLWTTLARRYRDEPAVLFDLLNEPHDPLGDDFLPICLIGEDGEIYDSQSGFVGPDEWLSWARRLLAEVRLIRPNGLILVSGVDWAFDLRHVRLDTPGIVYSAHIYPNRKPRDWEMALGRWKQVPVFVAEWGGKHTDLDFGRQLLETMRQRAIGWTAWSWADHPHLIVPPPAPDYRATAFGELVRKELRV